MYLFYLSSQLNTIQKYSAVPFENLSGFFDTKEFPSLIGGNEKWNDVCYKNYILNPSIEMLVGHCILCILVTRIKIHNYVLVKKKKKKKLSLKINNFLIRL